MGNNRLKQRHRLENQAHFFLLKLYSPKGTKQIGALINDFYLMITVFYHLF